MSITTGLATAAFAAAVTSFLIGSALANTKGPSGPPPPRRRAPTPAPQYGRPYHAGQHVEKLTTECYYLPTISNGSVSGLEEMLDSLQVRPVLPSSNGTAIRAVPIPSIRHLLPRRQMWSMFGFLRNML
jgi:hypothetical protein